jgi:dTDP-glucose pyrophosphorylase
MFSRAVTKAVVLAAGAGRRMRRADTTTELSGEQARAADAGHKAMIPIGPGTPRPFLDYILSTLADAGCGTTCVVIGRDHDEVQRYYEHERPPQRIQLRFARQDVPDGTAHALLAAEAFTGDDPFLTLNADNLYPVPVLRALAESDGPALAAFERDALVEDSGFAFERVASFALLDVDGDGYLKGIVEKPGAAQMRAAGSSALVSMNVWRFDRRIFQACRDVPRSARGEFELPEAVGLALARGVEFRAVVSRGVILDLSSRADIAHVSARLAQQSPAP